MVWYFFGVRENETGNELSGMRLDTVQTSFVQNQNLMQNKSLPLVYLPSWCRPVRPLCLCPSPLIFGIAWSFDGTGCERYTMVAFCGCGCCVTATWRWAAISFWAINCCCCFWSSALNIEKHKRKENYAKNHNNKKEKLLELGLENYIFMQILEPNHQTIK